jgi:hypothetical protein|tara:strand:- start:96 stop:731 length:636 start_codon:yes stop_codon:yes gene_type:complete
MNVTVAIAVLVVAVNVNVAAVNTMARGITDLWGSITEAVSNMAGISGSADMNFANQWGDNYHGKADDDKRKRAFEVLQSDFTVPTEAVDSINKSAFIFDGDMGFDSETIKENMTKIGAIESNYTTKVQEDEGPARSYWQVEPSTAKSLLNNSSALFGPKFNEVFAQYAEGDKTASEVLAGKSITDLQTLIENDSDLGAAFATAKMITTFET